MGMVRYGRVPTYMGMVQYGRVPTHMCMVRYGTQWVLHLFKTPFFLPTPRIPFEPQMTEEVDVLT